ncbi:immunity 49 family protein [Streptomyces sp. SA15]|uniref:immunity 49 family protein n=1 Tax=Streptomyces sp. SA15 TaxID=934019 RepID=UPI0026834F16|nr:immunity 49 family protein [Streptomyces sp. SA15]
MQAERIERHRVGEAAVSAVREDFANRIGSRVRSMSKAGPVTAYEWWTLAEEFVDYLGALSVETPDLDTPEAKAVLQDAAEAAAGAVAYAAYYPHHHFQVFLNYVNWGMVYDAGSEGGPEPVTAAEWLDAFCLAVLAGKAEWHGEAFQFAREHPQKNRAGRPDAELINGFMAYVIGDTGDDDADYPPSREEKLAAIDASLARIRALDAEVPEDLPAGSHGIALHALRALTAGDQEQFGRAVVRLLLPLTALPGPGARPRSLLPLLPLALTALAYRREGWPSPVDTGYLPHALITGFETPPPRVGAYGRDRRADAITELAHGVVEFERPVDPQPLTLESAAQFERFTREAFTPVPGERLAVWQLAHAMTDQEILFKTRASHSADVTDLQLANLRLAAELGAALFRTTLAEPGTDIEVTIDGTTVTYPAGRDDEAGPDAWHKAVDFALITGRREDLAPLVLAGPTCAGKDGSLFASYREALHDYLRCEDPEPATERALRDCEKAKDQGFFPPPAVLFSQLVEGDEQSFNLALLDALEAHRDHHRIADRATDCDAAINLDILALTCHARRRGWNIGVVSPYLPARILGAAVPF